MHPKRGNGFIGNDPANPDVVVAAAWTLILGQQGIVNTWLADTGWQVHPFRG